MNKIKTVIRVVSSHDKGGILQSEKQFARLLEGKGVRVIRIIVGSGDSDYEDGDVETYQISSDFNGYSGNPISKVHSLIMNFFIARSIRRKLRSIFAKIELEDDVVINIRRINLLSVALFLRSFLGGKVVYHSGISFRSGLLFSNYFYYFYISIIRSVNIIANSKYTAESIPFLSPPVVYPGFDPKRLTSESINPFASYSIKDNDLVFLYLGRLSYEKGADILFEAFSKTKAFKDYNAKLLVVGEAGSKSYFSRLNSIVEKNGLSENLLMVGPQKNVSDFYSCADVFVNCTRGVEAFGISIVEAMFSGLPVISNKLGGPLETVVDGKSGWYIESVTVDGLVEAIDRSIADRYKWGEMSMFAKHHSCQFAANTQVDRYLEVLGNM